MITATERKKIAKLILTTKDEKVVEKVKLLINFSAEKLISEHKKTYNKEIEKAVKEIKAGKFYTQDEADELLLKWEE